ncbi:unnamed protein product [Caenorhabditis nigoni]
MGSLKDFEINQARFLDDLEQDPIPVVPRCEKEFELKHIFKDAINFKEGIYNDSETDHFEVNWYMSVARLNNHLGFFIQCAPIAPSDKWSIQAKIELKVVGRNRNDVLKTMDYCYESKSGCGFPQFLEWEIMERRYLVDGNLQVEAKVTIIEANGLWEKKKTRKFDESQKDVSDVILIVGDTRFYVIKMYLASQSSVFKSLLLENSSASNQSELPRTGIDSNYFHCFLEVLYGEESAIDDSTVEGVLLLGDKFDAQTVIRRCVEFLLKESKKTLEKKQQLANCYNLENWVIKKSASELKMADFSSLNELMSSMNIN